MEVLIFQKEAFEEMAAKFSRFTERVDAILAKQDGKSLDRWMDNQEVCRQLNISPRTLQTLRDNGTLAYSQINHKVFYKPEDVMRIVKPVELPRAMRWSPNSATRLTVCWTALRTLWQTAVRLWAVNAS